MQIFFKIYNLNSLNVKAKSLWSSPSDRFINLLKLPILISFSVIYVPIIPMYGRSSLKISV